MKVFCKEFITVWTRGLVRWLSRKFDSISIDLTPVEEKVDDVKSDVADVKTAVDSTKQEIRNVAGPCIIPDFELPCLPFVPGGYCAIYGDADYVIGDFAPQTEAEQFEVGSIIHVTGDNATEEEFEGYPEGSPMAVAKTTLEPTGHAEGLYQDIESHMRGVTEEIIWQKGGYYRVTGIIECYSELTADSITIFTYEEVDPATITDMGKQIAKKVDEVKELIEEGGEDPNSKAVAAFFNITPPVPNAVPMTQQEVEDDLDELWNLIITQ